MLDNKETSNKRYLLNKAPGTMELNLKKNNSDSSIYFHGFCVLPGEFYGYEKTGLPVATDEHNSWNKNIAIYRKIGNVWQYQMHNLLFLNITIDGKALPVGESLDFETIKYFSYSFEDMAKIGIEEMEHNEYLQYIWANDFEE